MGGPTQGSAWQGDELVLLGNGEIAKSLPTHTRWVRANSRYSEVVDELARAKGSLVHVRTASRSGLQVMSMQLGGPPLVSAPGAPPEYRPSGLSITGIDDYEGLSKALDALVHPAEVDVQSNIVRNHYLDKYDAPIAARRYVEIFDDVASQG